MPVAAVSCVTSRRDAIIAAVEAYNRTHPPLPRPSARLLAVMFAMPASVSSAAGHRMPGSSSSPRLAC